MLNHQQSSTVINISNTSSAVFFAWFQEFLSSAKVNNSINEMISKDKLVFFLHLLGLDTNGHAYKPYST